METYNEYISYPKLARSVFYANYCDMEDQEMVFQKS